MKRLRKKQFSSSTDVRRELARLYHAVQVDELDLKKAEVLKGILNAIQISISGEAREQEVIVQERLAEQIEAARKGG